MENEKHSKRFYIVLLTVGLICLSAAFYFIHYLIFKDEHHIFMFLISDIAFIPMEVLIVSLILDKILEKREHTKKERKINMIIGAFFSEIGSPLLDVIANLVCDCGEDIREHLMIDTDWNRKKFRNQIKFLTNKHYDIHGKPEDLKHIKGFLTSKRTFLLSVIENPLVLEHDEFTDMLLSLFHLTEELVNRPDLRSLPESDMEHLNVDMLRAFSKLVVEWMRYMKYLKKDYPYLYSFAVRTNPFNPEAVITV